mmetsp:Transcript_52430/g.47072  ORF Transcript_52430/g.47072 Transcript_52430/m.47072 type:complete len:654 (-) Transcript_52430:50-2011(-)
MAASASPTEETELNKLMPTEEAKNDDQATKPRSASSAAENVVPSTLFSHPVQQPDTSEDGKASTNLDGEQKDPPQSEYIPDVDIVIDQDTEKEAETLTQRIWKEHKDRIILILKIVFGLFWIAYSLAAFIIDFERARVLFIIECIIISIVVVRILYDNIGTGLVTQIIAAITSNPKLVYAIYSVMVLLAIIVIILCTYEDPGRLVAALGLCIFIGLCWIFSWNRRAIKWRPVIWGFSLQFTFGLFILRTQPGFEIFKWLGEAFSVLLDFTFYGTQFTFGYLATNQFSWPEGDSPEGFGQNGASVFAFSVIPTVIFFGSLVSVLYYLGVLQVCIYYLSVVMQYTLGTSSSESLNAAGNIFVGMTEAPLLIKPFLANMTRSELHAVMTGGFATIAGGVMAIYISFGVPAAHLLTASVMSAPAALAISKIVYPEDEISPTANTQNKDKKNGDGDEDEDDLEKVLKQIGAGNETNVIEAAANGAAVAISLAANIIGMLIAFLALIALLDYIFSWWGSLINWDITFTTLCGYLFYPVALAMGIEPSDAQIAGELIGQKVVINEFVAYLGLLGALCPQDEDGNCLPSLISARSEVILIYALCGFSNFGAIGITIGGLTPLAPKRGKDLTELVLSAMIAGNVACFMTACIAALLYDPDRY